MEKDLITPPQLLQQLIAVHTTRIEVCSTITNQQSDATLNGRLDNGKQQSKQFISELMEELTGFGDAVSSQVNHDTAYNSRWIAAKPGIEHADENATRIVFDELENILKDEYQQMVDEKVALPETIITLIKRQQEALA